MRELGLRGLSRTVWVLALASLLNDAASEMIAPLLPLFLTVTLGAGPAAVGIVEGVAEAAASVLKIVSGRLSDRGWDRRRMTIGGYLLSNLARPLVAFATAWTAVLGLRFCDRIGKGIRTSPRDALLSASVPMARRGAAFGLHRGLDHVGATIGPLLAFAMLKLEVPLPRVFLLSIIPGALVVLLLVGFLERERRDERALPPPPKLRWAALDARVRALVLAAGGLALASTPEAFLVLWAYRGGVKVEFVPLLWAAAHGVKSLVAIGGGRMSDHHGRAPVLAGGWLVRSSLLAAIPFIPAHPAPTWTLFLAYAGSLAFTEGAERAMIGDFAPPEQKGTAFGLYHVMAGLLALPGAAMFGAIWEYFGMKAAFFTAATISILTAWLFVQIARRRPV